MFELIHTLPKPYRGQTLYCNCQKESCSPCPNGAQVLANTEDGSLQLCKKCMKEYETDKPTNLEIGLNGMPDVNTSINHQRGNGR